MTTADRPTTVGELMSPDPIVVWPDTSVAEVAEVLDRAGISGVPVVDWSGYLVGLVSQADVARAMPDAHVADLVGTISDARPNN